MDLDERFKITDEEWERLPPRTKLLLNAGFVDLEECIRGWRQHWKEKSQIQENDDLEGPINP